MTKISWTTSKNSACKIQITVKKYSDLRYFMNAFFIDRHRLQHRLLLVASRIHPPNILLSYLRGWDGNIQCFLLKYEGYI